MFFNVSILVVPVVFFPIQFIKNNLFFFCTCILPKHTLLLTVRNWILDQAIFDVTGTQFSKVMI